MARLHQLLERLLTDRRITDDEVEAIREFMAEDGELDLADVKFLVQVLSEARSVCPAFDELFFPILERVVLADGEIGRDEQFYLLKMLYTKGHIRDSERRFLTRLRQQATAFPAEFDELFEIALQAPATGWSVDGVLPAPMASR